MKSLFNKTVHNLFREAEKQTGMENRKKEKSMKDCSNITLLVPQNDLESVTIADIAQRIGFHRVILSEQTWGARLEREPHRTFDQIETKELWIVEIPGPEKERELEQNDDIRIKVIDHHHHDEKLDRSHPLSSLEQFAAACGYELTEHERWVAINDRAYIWGLLDEGASLNKIKEIRTLDFDAQLRVAGLKDDSRRKAALTEILKACEEEYKKNIEGTIEKDPLCTRPIFFYTTELPHFGRLQDLYHLPDQEAYDRYKADPAGYDRRNLCIFKMDLCRRLESVHYSGSTHYFQAISDAFKDQKVDCWSGGEEDYGFCGVRIKPDYQPQEFRLHRMPIKKFTTIFLYPFKFDDEAYAINGEFWHEEPFKLPTHEGHLTADAANAWQLQLNYAEYIYFHDYVRSFLYSVATEETAKEGTDNPQPKSNGQNTRYFRYPLSHPALVQLKAAKVEHPLSAFITDIHLHLFPGAIGILSIETTNIPDRIEQIDPKEVSGTRLISTGEEVLLFNNMFRRVYPAYFEKGDFDKEEKDPQNPTQVNNREFPQSIRIDALGYCRDLRMDNVYFQTRLSNNPKDSHYPTLDNHLVNFLLRKLLKRTDQKDSYASALNSILPILDDRMLVHTYLAFPGNIQEMITDDALKIFFSYLLYVDNPQGAHTYRYAPGFTEGLMQANTNQRWAQYRTWIGFCRYASARLFFGHMGDLYRPFASMYYQMYLLAIYYRARLVSFSGEIGNLALDLPEQNLPTPRAKRDYRSLHARFVKFMNRHWFLEVTHQDQGIEEFQLMRRAMDLDAMYQQVKEQIERADELMELYHAKEVERFQTKLGWVGAIFGVLSIVSSYFALSFKWEPLGFHRYLMPILTAFFVTGLVLALIWLTKNNKPVLSIKLLKWSPLVFVLVLVYLTVSAILFSKDLPWLKILLPFIK